MRALRPRCHRDLRVAGPAIDELEDDVALPPGQAQSVAGGRAVPIGGPAIVEQDQGQQVGHGPDDILDPVVERQAMPDTQAQHAEHCSPARIGRVTQPVLELPSATGSWISLRSPITCADSALISTR